MMVLRKQEIETANIQVGDQIVIPLAELGEFTATAHKVTDEGVMFIFDEYVTCRPMNNCSTNKGGFEKSDLKKWMDTVLFMAFPEELRDKIRLVSLLWATMALRPPTALRTLVEFVRNSGWLSRNLGALCPVDLAVILGALMLVQKTFCIIVRMM